MKIKLSHLLLSLFLVSLSHIGYSQDLDIYPKNNNDKFELPDIPKDMSFDEFQILSRDIKMMDIASGLIVPGYVHFKAKENTTGYLLLAGRVISYAGIYYSYTQLKKADYSWNSLDTTEETVRQNLNLYYASLGAAAFTFFFDWINGKYILEEKQEKIRYKYSMKLKVDPIQTSNLSTQPAFGVSVQYNF